MSKNKTIREYIETSIPEDVDYEVEHEWVSVSQSLHRRERFVIVTFTSPLDDVYEDTIVPTMLDGSSDSIVYYCTEEREDTNGEWTQVSNQYDEIWQIHNNRP